MLLRQLQIPASTSSSSSEHDIADDIDSSRDFYGSDQVSVPESGRVPNAQRTDGDGYVENTQELEAETDDVEVELGPPDSTIVDRRENTCGGENAGNISKEDTDNPSDEESAPPSGEDNTAGAPGSSPGSSLSRKRALSDDREQLYYVPAAKKYHKSWEKLDAYLKTYQRKTSTLLAISETMNVHLCNNKIAKMKTHVEKPASEIPFVP
ncbi:hypothetical protein PHYPSEUDO_002777 [Phytophthora pseudosyringae]|uniref:Uncharacterized protein n=1 Tax=Phytophthora pseudosyringae TaxID=221518 RepID=A0A8T1VSC2_9STRA|nr:hypothetical protein PHYPSEUDO_002777 [Phytophthora pseudosyringae]